MDIMHPEVGVGAVLAAVLVVGGRLVVGAVVS